MEVAWVGGSQGGISVMDNGHNNQVDIAPNFACSGGARIVFPWEQ